MTETVQADVIIVGGGIIGSACAYELAKNHLRVIVVDDAQVNATQAGMGHLVCIDDHPAELALSSYALELWRSLVGLLPPDCAWRACGTLWLADKNEEMEVAETKKMRLAAHGIESQWISGTDIAKREPLLRSGLVGGLHVASDGIVYAPNVARWLRAAYPSHISLITTEVVALDEKAIVLANGQQLKAPKILLANGLKSTQLVPQLPIAPKKGQLAITDRYPHCVYHQLIELGYGASAHAAKGSSVAFNVQARPTGQLLIGSSRQYDSNDDQIDLLLMQQMLQRAIYFLPKLRQMNIIRCWSGLRAATTDGLPIIGQHPDYDWLWLAVGHEGLGVTTAPATAALIAAQMQGNPTTIDPIPFLPERFLSTPHIAS